MLSNKFLLLLGFFFIGIVYPSKDAKSKTESALVNAASTAGTATAAQIAPSVATQAEDFAKEFPLLHALKVVVFKGKPVSDSDKNWHINCKKIEESEILADGTCKAPLFKALTGMWNALEPASEWTLALETMKNNSNVEIKKRVSAFESLLAEQKKSEKEIFMNQMVSMLLDQLKEDWKEGYLSELTRLSTRLIGEGGVRKIERFNGEVVAREAVIDSNVGILMLKSIHFGSPITFPQKFRELDDEHMQNLPKLDAVLTRKIIRNRIKQLLKGSFWLVKVQLPDSYLKATKLERNPPFWKAWSTVLSNADSNALIEAFLHTVEKAYDPCQRETIERWLVDFAEFMWVQGIEGYLKKEYVQQINKLVKRDLVKIEGDKLKFFEENK